MARRLREERFFGGFPKKTNSCGHVRKQGGGGGQPHFLNQLGGVCVRENNNIFIWACCRFM